MRRICVSWKHVLQQGCSKACGMTVFKCVSVHLHQYGLHTAGPSGKRVCASACLQPSWWWQVAVAHQTATRVC